MSFWSVNCWSAKYTVHPYFFVGTFYFSNLMGTRIKKNLGWEDPGGGWGGGGCAGDYLVYFSYNQNRPQKSFMMMSCLIS